MPADAGAGGRRARRGVWLPVAALATGALLLTIALGSALSRLAFAAGPVPASVAYAAQLVPIYGDAAKAHQIGLLTPATAIDVAGPLAKASLVRFTLDGWFQGAERSSLYIQEDQRIVLATFPAAPTGFQTLGHATDPFGSAWTRARVDGYVDPNLLVASQNTVWQQAEKLYASRCSACHALHKTTHFTANQWPATLQVMAKNAALDPAQRALITQYLQMHARP